MQTGTSNKNARAEEKSPAEVKGKQSMSSRTYEYLKPTSKMKLHDNTLRSVLRSIRPPAAADADGGTSAAA